MGEIVYLEGWSTERSVFHAVGVPSYGAARITACGVSVSLAMPEAQRVLAERRARPCLRCYPRPRRSPDSEDGGMADGAALGGRSG